MEKLEIQEITQEFHGEAKHLILEGMKERFGFIDYSLNPDLNNIYEHYTMNGHLFLIGFLEETMVGTGALTKECSTIGRIERMSVGRPYRRKGIAQRMLDQLEGQAIKLGYSKIVLETNQEWHSAIAFYKKNGFVFDYHEGERIHFFKLT
ncbi:GNAT family N-acetyltransferase [Virgibacillus phasianinus]|nr:GNAT family N-acetyltransferase [Virgibacillus phasianinus]